MDWKKMATEEFVFGVIATIIGLVVYDKFVKKYLKL